MNGLLEEIYRSRRVEDAHGTAVDPFPSGTPRETAAVLRRLVLEHGLERTLEIGMAYGLSTLCLCQAHAERGSGSHIAIDPNQHGRYRGIGALNVERAGLGSYLRFLEAPSHEALPQLLREGVEIDFAYVDGAHFFDNVVLEFSYVDKLLRLGGLIVFDDVWMPAVRRAVSFVLRNRSYRLRPVRVDWSLRFHVVEVARRLARSPLERDPGRLRFSRGNICLLEKTGEDERAFGFHRAF